MGVGCPARFDGFADDGEPEVGSEEGLSDLLVVGDDEMIGLREEARELAGGAAVALNDRLEDIADSRPCQDILDTAQRVDDPRLGMQDEIAL
jgi:hypothetical protein